MTKNSKIAAAVIAALTLGVPFVGGAKHTTNQLVDCVAFGPNGVGPVKEPGAACGALLSSREGEAAWECVESRLAWANSPYRNAFCTQWERRHG